MSASCRLIARSAAAIRYAYSAIVWRGFAS
jgi:hypothetical protein